MEKLGWYEFSAEGLSLERLLNQCAEQGVRLHGIKKSGARKVIGSVAAADAPKLQALAEKRGWRLTIGKAHGPVKLGKIARKRAFLLSGILVFLFACWGAMSCVWFIDVRGAGPYTGEVERILQEHEVRVGRLGFLIDTDALREDMERQLTGLAWVGVKTSGVRLTVSCVQAQLAKGAASAPGDLVASRDGVISSVTVTAGTPLVKEGDVVRKGQVLVRGEERAWNGAVNPVRAQASVRARVWYDGSAYVSGTLLQSVPTGAASECRTLVTPFYHLAFDAPPAYADCDVSKRVLPLAGPYPVWMQVERYEEVVRHEIPREEEDVREEAALAAVRLAQEKVPFGVSVIDKWVEYSMIKDEGCRATAVLEALIEIAVPSDETLPG